MLNPIDVFERDNEREVPVPETAKIAETTITKTKKTLYDLKPITKHSARVSSFEVISPSF
ncbi:MAG: hypothetical protein KDA80_00345 [Planctomycetaceae bacterium]|nr:hypothetical protein [Planctomycetaceae bacterium]